MERMNEEQPSEEIQSPALSHGSIEPPEDHLRKLLFWSFFFSQGEPELQWDIFSYIHCLHPEWKITNTMREHIERLLCSQVGRFLTRSNGSVHARIMNADSKIQPEVSMRARQLQDVLNGLRIQKARVLIDLCRNLIGRDHEYLVETDGRPLREAVDQNIYRDRYLSHLCHFGFHGRTTHVPEYDQMFADVMKELREQAEMGLHRRSKLRKIVERYNHHHPDDVVDYSFFRRRIHRFLPAEFAYLNLF